MGYIPNRYVFAVGVLLVSTKSGEDGVPCLESGRLRTVGEEDAIGEDQMFCKQT